MRNPWKDLAINGDGKYVADCDKDYLRSFDEITDDKMKLQLKVLPEPFIGDPATASFVALQLNPGVAPSDDYEKGISSDYRAFKPKHEDILANLTGERREMYWAEPTPNLGEGDKELYSAPHTWYFGAEIKTKSGWEHRFAWRSRFQLLLLALSSQQARSELRKLQPPSIGEFHEVVLNAEGENFPSSLNRAYGILRKNFAVIEYFPYHSEKADRNQIRKSNLPSQEYTSHLLDQAIDNGAYIFLTRSVTPWGNLSAKLLQRGEQLIIAAAPQSPTFTPGNVCKWDITTGRKGAKDPNLFWKVVEKLDPEE
ncbi:hypothetical protein [Corynebacterium pelargi]|uniref:Uncharacterized protein n=1 Tax=Corynebacterium pelargi TaxID=1471400 RepID=A0A410W6R2_9CORY|nr:hypothetical protein [Corynebacterium pelargi]QAU51564.1 hypothetical protein CPELA_01320 [Corynebacterium pelargi]GGG82378.1 hypothetical protein GCM10007338_21610 [Corynebacterium pelargi]